MTTYLAEDIESVLSPLTLYPSKVPSDNTASYPCVVYQNVTGIPVRTHSGNVLKRYRYRFSCWGMDYASSLATAETVKQKLDLNQTNWKLSTLQNETDAIEIEPSMYRVILEFFIWSIK